MRPYPGYLDLVGYRLLDGFDIAEPYALELPDVLLRAIRIAVPGRDDDSAEVDDRIAGVRSKVPEQHRAEFDELLGEARLTYRLRDERGVFSDIWASGLMRRAALAGGRRAGGGGAASTSPSTSSTPASTRCARCSADGEGPPADELAARAAYRASHTREGSPAVAGRPAAAAAGPVRPAAGRRAADARDGDRAWPRCSAARRRSTRTTCCAGLPPAAGVYEGPARLRLRTI